MILFVVVLVCYISGVAADCALPTGFPGVCKSESACKGTGLWTGTGECPGTERCCTVEYCYVGGLRGVCVNPGACTGTSHTNYCTGDGKCCTHGSAPPCAGSGGSGSTKLSIDSVNAQFLDSDREVATKIEYCGTAASSACATINPPSKVQVRWSQPSASSSNQGFTAKSGLGFQPRSAIGEVPINDVFPIGTLTHYNFVVTGSTPAYVHMQLSLSVGGVTVPPFKYKLGIDETNNQAGLFQCAYQSVVPCADKIDFPESGFSFIDGQKAQGSVSFRLPGSNIDLTLELGGFKRDCNDNAPLDYWYTQEKVVNQAVLYGRITRACPIASTCIGGDVIYDKANCRCKVQPAPTPAPPPPPTDAPTPMPPTPQPTPRPPPPVGFSWAPTPPPTSQAPTPPTPMPTPGEIVIVPAPTPVPNAPTPEPCTPWYACLSSPPTPPPDVPTPAPTPQQSVFIVEESSDDNTALIAGLAGGIGGCLIISGIVLALCLLMGGSSAMTGASAAQPANDNIVENNPLFYKQANEQSNPLFYSQPGQPDGNYSIAH